MYAATLSLFITVLLAASATIEVTAGPTTTNVKDDPFLNDTFPDGFIWGTATSAYQIEGAWNESGMSCVDKHSIT